MLWTRAAGPGDRDPLGLQMLWTRAVGLGDRDTVSVWTIDGFGLDELLFFSGVAAGSPLLRISGRAPKDIVLYNTAMLPDDVIDIISRTLRKAGDPQLRTSALPPVPFGTLIAFLFALTFT